MLQSFALVTRSVTKKLGPSICGDVRPIDDAIEEFEAMYREKLWSSVVNEEESLRRAIDKFRVFDEYRSKIVKTTKG